MKGSPMKRNFGVGSPVKHGKHEKLVVGTWTGEGGANMKGKHAHAGGGVAFNKEDNINMDERARLLEEKDAAMKMKGSPAKQARLGLKKTKKKKN